MSGLMGPCPGAALSAQGGRAPPKPSGQGPLCGIYGVFCTANEKWYVGQSVNIKQRWADHARKLRNRAHGNPHLQAAWNKYGPASFLWIVLANLTIEELLDMAEAAAISEFQAMSPSGFNLREAGANGRPSAETRALWSKNRRGRRLSRAACSAMSHTRKGKPHSRAHSRAILNGKVASYLRKLSDNGYEWGWKQCRRCGDWKPFSEYGAERRVLDGHKSSCRKCEGHARHKGSRT